jgi:diaminopimelate decarboxylase
MDYFSYRKNELYAEDAPVAAIAKTAGTPFYCYSARTIRGHFGKLRSAFAEMDALIAYSIKANSTLAILKLLEAEGAGFDVTSGGELYRALKVGADPKKIVYAGVGKTAEEIREALNAGIGLFNAESAAELERIEKLAAETGKKASASIRINPDVDAHTHKHITTGKKENKFGIDMETARSLYKKYRSSKHLTLSAVHIHIGSQITQVEPYEAALKQIAAFVLELRGAGCEINAINTGGGFGIFYRGDEAKTAEDFARTIVPILKPLKCRLILEPGRFIVGNAGILVAEVQYVKKTPTKTFVIVDTGMQHLIRPMLYDAYHRVWPVHAPFLENEKGATASVDVVGPICESTDVLAKERPLPALKQGDLVAIFSAGAYGFAMASNYNSHPRPAEILVDGKQFRVIRARESYDDLVRGEKI